MPRLLVIDDELAILECFRYLFTEEEATLATATTGAEGLAEFERFRPDVVIVDVRLPDLPGLEVFRRIHELNAEIPVILITGYGTAGTAIEAIRLGAYDYVVKPLDPDLLRELTLRALETGRLMRSSARLVPSETVTSEEVLVGNCPAMREVYKSIGRVAPRDVAVLILGESGTGKELVARALYHYSSRSAGKFLTINCAAIPETLLESELFGHEKGAFTGADRRRIGKFEQCHRGTLFLDEIGDMTPLTQTKILRALQDGRFERVGGNETVEADVRIIAATNRDLGRLMEEGRFRQDLFYRLNVYTIRLPPLRDRGEDLPLLVEHFVQRFRRELNKDIHGLAPETLERLRRYPWPGNVRELQSVLKQTILQATGPVLVPEFLPEPVRGEDGTLPAPLVGHLYLADLTNLIEERLRVGSTDLLAEFLTVVERHLFLQVLHHTKINQSEAARILGITRTTLRTKLAALGISLGRWTSVDEGRPV